MLQAPVKESYPRMCDADGQTFVEEIADLSPELTQCEPKRPEVCTSDYNPVCALKDNGIRCITEPCPSFDAVTQSNSCSACSDSKVIGHYPGACEDNHFVICENSVFDVRKITSDNNRVCVDICPKNYDAYTNQIGAKTCITHYGLDKIGRWRICNSSSDSCDCVKAYETTTNDPIEDAEFRCVPEQYAERLLFRNGQERLDETGDNSVVIA